LISDDVGDDVGNFRDISGDSSPTTSYRAYIIRCGGIMRRSRIPRGFTLLATVVATALAAGAHHSYQGFDRALMDGHGPTRVPPCPRRTRTLSAKDENGEHED
jgi:hypothetical protein